jgi:hypothetical protein
MIAPRPKSPNKIL